MQINSLTRSKIQNPNHK